MSEKLHQNERPETYTASPQYLSIDHIAFAVKNLDEAIILFRDVLGFTLINRRTIRGKSTGMVSAEMEHRGLKFVLCEGTEEASQVTRLISENGPGVAHIALSVDDVRHTAANLKSKGLEFDTGIIEGAGLVQTFSRRCKNTGLCLELIKRDAGISGFEDGNIQALFDQLEESERF